MDRIYQIMSLVGIGLCLLVVFLLAFFACFALNLLSAAIPAWRVTRTNIVDAINER